MCLHSFEVLMKSSQLLGSTLCIDKSNLFSLPYSRHGTMEIHMCMLWEIWVQVYSSRSCGSSSCCRNFHLASNFHQGIQRKSFGLQYLYQCYWGNIWTTYRIFPNMCFQSIWSNYRVTLNSLYLWFCHSTSCEWFPLTIHIIWRILDVFRVLRNPLAALHLRIQLNVGRHHQLFWRDWVCCLHLSSSWSYLTTAYPRWLHRAPYWQESRLCWRGYFIPSQILSIQAFSGSGDRRTCTGWHCTGETCVSDSNRYFQNLQSHWSELPSWWWTHALAVSIKQSLSLVGLNEWAPLHGTPDLWYSPMALSPFNLNSNDYHI